MQKPTLEERPIRVGFFDTLPAAEAAVINLRDAGFTPIQISVVSSNEEHLEWLLTFIHQHPAGSEVPAAAAKGSAIGAVIGGLSAAAGAAFVGADLLATSGTAAWTGGILGGFIGAMMKRGIEKELANYYQQAVLDGKILVAVETHDKAEVTRLPLAERIFNEAGTEPLSMREG